MPLVEQHRLTKVITEIQVIITYRPRNKIVVAAFSHDWKISRINDNQIRIWQTSIEVIAAEFEFDVRTIVRSFADHPMHPEVTINLNSVNANQNFLFSHLLRNKNVEVRSKQARALVQQLC